MKCSSSQRYTLLTPHADHSWLGCIDPWHPIDSEIHCCICAAKSDRLKQAKQEAEKEIKAYKAQREEAFQKRMSDVSQPLDEIYSTALSRATLLL